MTQGAPELLSGWKFLLIEREKEYYLTARLYRSRLVVEDERGNKISINKRRRAIRIERWGNVEELEQ